MTGLSHLLEGVLSSGLPFLPSLSPTSQLTAIPQLPLSLAAVTGHTEFSIFRTFMQAGPVAKLVLFILVSMSVLSWIVMISKFSHFRKVSKQNQHFLNVFRRSARFSEINAAAGQFNASPLVGMFQAGYVEIDAQVKALREQAGADNPQYKIMSIEGIQRSLQRARGIEVQTLTRNSAILATVAAAAPFIGLFGTVWGIMIAFNDIGATGSASIVAVAPGIAEALVNTAAGLVAAIPALIGYNLIANRVRIVRSEMEDFALEFLNLTERNFT